jgi:ABC-type amino acid transport substrate-binding protein
MHISKKISQAAGVCLVVGAGLSSAAGATPVLERIAGGGKLVIAHRESSIPFSYLDNNKQPVGYAIDLCLKIAEAVRRKTGARNMAVELLMVTPANRIATIEQGKADLECGSTTNNQERRTKVAFTIPHFITGARLLVRADSPVVRIEDLSNKKLVSTKDTTPLKAAEQANRERLLNVTIMQSADHAKGVDMVESSEADAFIMDDVLLYGLAASRKNPAALKVVGKFLTTEPLAIMLPKDDPEFKKVVDEEMRRLIVSRDINPIYEKWFQQPIPPKGTSLNMPVSYLLKDFWKYPSDFVPF